MNITQNIHKILLVLCVVIIILVYKLCIVEQKLANIEKNNVVETMADTSGINTEALATLSSMYENGKLKITDLEVTNNLTVDGSTTTKTLGVDQGIVANSIRSNTGYWFGKTGNTSLTTHKSPNWINVNTSLQQTNGGWFNMSNVSAGNIHTTALEARGNVSVGNNLTATNIEANGSMRSPNGYWFKPGTNARLYQSADWVHVTPNLRSDGSIHYHGGLNFEA
jgi:hypothetical protein